MFFQYFIQLCFEDTLLNCDQKRKPEILAYGYSWMNKKSFLHVFKEICMYKGVLYYLLTSNLIHNDCVLKVPKTSLKFFFSSDWRLYNTTYPSINICILTIYNVHTTYFKSEYPPCNFFLACFPLSAHHKIPEYCSITFKWI